MRKDIKNKVVRRLKIIEGQICGLQRMVDHEKYCVDIITQISAVKESLSSVGDLMLENHLSTHVIHHIEHGKKDHAVQEILKIYKLAQHKK
ncbi:MAG: metal-sensing transcriptional repressor [Candidatus Wildermuthbacteria bacterium]|nr:metal-sensing transcriptional repressor [Candidatus Wildermuthbacteria bacterium]